MARYWRAMTAIRSDAGGRAVRSLVAIAFACLLSACVSERTARDEAPAEPVVHESRTGVPLLMDLPLIGWLFQHRTTVR